MTSTMSICDRRGHYYLPIEMPVSNGFTWSLLPPAPERVLYCRRCGHVKSLGNWSAPVSISTDFPAIRLTNMTVFAMPC